MYEAQYKKVHKINSMSFTSIKNKYFNKIVNHVLLFATSFFVKKIKPSQKKFYPRKHTFL